MKTFNTLRVVPTQDGYIVLVEATSEVLINRNSMVCQLQEFELSSKLTRLLDYQPEEDNNATE